MLVIMRILAWMASAFLVGCAHQAKETAPGRVEHVVIISIDGLRPDLLLRADAPNIRRLMREGSFTMWAETTDVATTLPSHVSMLTGVAPLRHDVWWDYDIFGEWFHHPKVPTLFDLAKQHGLSTAMAAGKSKFTALNRPGSVDWYYIPEDYANNTQVTQTAAEFIRDHRPNVVFAHLPDADAFGHGNGWGSPQQFAAIATADRGVGMILEALRRAKIPQNTVVIVTADHGGAGDDHGGNDPRSHTIPWIICGPGIRKGFDLTLCGELRVRTDDTFATACRLLDLPLDEDLDGKVISQAME